MEVALYARVSTSQQQHEGTIESQRRALQHHIQHHGWSLLPEHEYIDDGISGARLDRPALDRLRDAARRGEFDAVVILSPDRLARNYAHQWLLIEEFEKMNTPLIFLQNPFGDSPQGKLLTQMQGMIAEYERAQIAERTRRGRLEKARHGAFMPWAYTCYGYHYLPKRHGCAPQVMIDPVEAAVVRDIYRALVEEQLSCRQITKRLNVAKTPTPTGKNAVWQHATVHNILANRTYTGQARYNYRQPVLPQSRKKEEHRLQYLKTGRRYRAESEWVWSEAPAIISGELFDKAQLQLQRNAAIARKMYRPTSRRYLLRTLVQCGECGLGMVCIRQRSGRKKYEYLSYACKGYSPLSVGRTTTCHAKLVRADRLDTLVWDALEHLLHQPSVIPHLHQTWAEAKQHTLSGLEAHQAQLLRRQQRIERQDQRLLDAYQAEIINLPELQTRRQKLAAELHQIAQESRQLAHTRHQSIHWQHVMDNTATFRQLLGENLAQLSFEERQAIAQCLIRHVIVTGEAVDIHFLLPFASTPQAARRLPKEPEGTPGHFYRLRLAHFLHTPLDVAFCAGQRDVDAAHGTPTIARHARRQHLSNSALGGVFTVAVGLLNQRVHGLAKIIDIAEVFRASLGTAGPLSRFQLAEDRFDLLPVIFARIQENEHTVSFVLCREKNSACSFSLWSPNIGQVRIPKGLSLLEQSVWGAGLPRGEPGDLGGC